MRLMVRRRKAPAQKLTTQARKLDVFIVDTGRDAALSELLRCSDAIDKLRMQHRVFVLSRQQSREVIAKCEELAGREPVLVLSNSDGRVEQRRGKHGIRICLGDLHLAAAKEVLGQIPEVADSTETTAGMVAQLFRRVKAEADKNACLR